MGQPHGKIPPKWFLDIDPGCAAFARLLRVNKGRGEMPRTLGNVQRLRQITEEQGAAIPFILAADGMVEAIPIKPPHRFRGQSPIFPGIGFIPPCDNLRHVQILGPHQQLNIREWPVNMGLAAPPAFFPQIRKALEANG
jgi:hypothetical protein